jgi:transposase
MLEEILLPTKWQVIYERYELTENALTLTARFVAKQADCTYCGFSATRVHSRYLRRPFDLPSAAHPVRFNLEVRRFFCDNPDCEKRTFTEQVPALLGFRGRRTLRQTKLLQDQALALGGEAGARTLAKMGITISPDTLLRLIKSSLLPQRATPRVLGVDDWAKRKGRNYGTILVNLEAHQVVDLLPDDKAQTLVDWLQLHPGVEIISRDRASAYADGARRGAPEAMQVADRFHLLKNLVDYLKAVFERKRASLRETQALPLHDTTVTAARVEELAKPLSLEVVDMGQTPQYGSNEEKPVGIEANNLGLVISPQPQTTKTSRKQELFEQIKQLKKQNYSQRLIALTLGISRHTVTTYLKAGQPPRFRPRASHSKLDPYKPYLLTRWQGGCYKRKDLYEEIRERGYRGSGSLLGLYLLEVNKQHPRRIHYRGWHGLGKPGPNPLKKPLIPRQLLSATQAAFLMIKEQADLAERDVRIIEHLTHFDTELFTLYELSQQFVGMVRQRQPHKLESWLLAVEQGATEELKSFASGIRQDRQAVEAGLREEWSQGQVEGQVNRLKTVKRDMYGRASFELLRARVLLAA